MTTSLGKIVDSFPDPIIPPIVGALIYEYLVELFEKINGNAAYIQTNLGGGGGFIYPTLTVTPVLYATLSATTFKSPSNPRAAPAYHPGATGIKESAI